MTPRARAKRGEGDRLRDEIVDAAEAILLDTGSTDKVSTRAVAARVGCTSPSIYLHFPDRAQLLFAVCERQFEKLADRLDAVASRHPDPEGRLRAVGLEYCRFALENPQQYRTMMMDVIAGVVYERSFDEMRAELGFDLVVDTVVDGIDQGLFADVDPLIAAFAFWCAAHGLVSLMIAKPKIEWPDDDSLLELTLGLTIDGIRVRPSIVEAPTPPVP